MAWPAEAFFCDLAISHFWNIISDMEHPLTLENADMALAVRLKHLRRQRNWSLDQLSQHSQISRATLSRMENGDVSPTAHVLGKLCAAYGLTLSRLMLMVETRAAPLLRRGEQPVWQDTATGFTRRTVSPPSDHLSCEVLECTLAAGATIHYPRPPKTGLEHHLLLTRGALEIGLDDTTHRLGRGDCLRYHLFGPSSFRADPDLGAGYYLVVL